MTNVAGRSSGRNYESSFLQKALIVVVMLILLSSIISGAYAKSYPRIYWQWPGNPIEETASNLDIYVYYVSDDNRDTGTLDRATMGTHDYGVLPKDCMGKNVVIRLETKSDEFLIYGQTEHDFQISMGDYSYTFSVAPQKTGISKVQLEYSVDGKNFVPLTPAIKVSVVD